MNEPYDPLNELHFDKLSDANVPSEMEERLVRCRPRLPRLDIEAVIKLANPEETSSPATTAGKDRSGRYSTSQLVGTIAASWVCGVAVGAYGIIYSMSNREPTANDNESAASIHRAEVKEIETEKIVNHPTLNADSTISEFLGNATQDDWLADWNSAPLQVGMSLRSRSRLVRATDSSSYRLSAQMSAGITSQNGTTDNESSSSSDSLDLKFVPTSPMTKAELLKELLKDSRFIIH